jgi:surface polysaccharide O-acyltransferase-like enzyme
MHVSPKNYKQDRVASIDLFKVFAIFAVIILHTSPFAEGYTGSYAQTVAVTIELICRFAVPYFFMVYGYFFSQKLLRGRPVMATFWLSAKRLMSLYVVWNIFYLLLPLKYLYEIRFNTWPSFVWKNLQEQWPSFLILGSNYVLWFLPALVCGLGILAFCLSRGWEKEVLYIALFIHCLGLLWGSYSLLVTQSDAMDFIIGTRNGPFFSTLYVTVGWLMIRREPKPIDSLRILGWIGFGLVLQVIEANFLSAAASVPMRSFDYLIGTFALSTGLFLLALANPKWGSDWPILSWSQYSLGVFLIHPIFRDLLQPLDNRYHHLLWEMALPCMIYLLSLITTALLAKHRLLKKWVT